MTVHKLTAGDGYTYLSRQVAAHDTTEPTRNGLEPYYSDNGETPGRWLGGGLAAPGFPALGAAVDEAQMLALFGQGRHPDALAIKSASCAAGADPLTADRATQLGSPFPVFEGTNEFRQRCAVGLREHNARAGLRATSPVAAADRARIRTHVAAEMFRDSFGREAAGPRELSGHLARISRQATRAVAGYDLTFSPVKSVSTLWAIAPLPTAAVIEQSHADAVADVIGWIERTAAFTRTGRQGIAQVDVRGLIAASFTHRDSRAGDPDLHTHVAISNKVQTLDGRWLALDGRAIFKNNVAASERYNTRLEALLTDRLGVQFADRSDGAPGKRPVREITGVDGLLPGLWSSRRAAISTRQAALATDFQRDHGRPPTTKEAIALAQQANLETREAKHNRRSHAEQRATWRAEALAVLDGAGGLQRYVDGALHPTGLPARQDVTPAWTAAMAEAVLGRITTSRATWQETHVRAEAERQARSSGVTLSDVDDAVEGIVRVALSPRFSVRLAAAGPALADPGPLRRADGTSVFEVAGSALFTSDEVLDAERAVLDAAGRRDGRITPATAVDDAVRAAAVEGRPLNLGQEQLVRDLATSGARVQLALAPAGSGKTTALRALATAWRAGGGSVLGLAPSAAASALLRDQIGTHTDTLAKLMHAVTTGLSTPAWLPEIGPDTLVLVDEAGAASTTELAAAVDLVVRTGASIRLVGDDQQLGSVGAGGLLRDLAGSPGAVRLDQVVRFVHLETGVPNRAEGGASLALRAGDPAGLAHYADNSRLHVGDLGWCTEHAYRAWAEDRAEGRDSLMIAPTRELVAQLNQRARAERITRVREAGPEVSLREASTASAGDVVVTRQNRRTLAIGPTNWVKNGDRWTVLAVHGDGGVQVAHLGTGRRVTLPPEYVAHHVTLGYASTVHGAQGMTVDRCYTVATGQESRQLLYVALTRGRHENHVFLATVGDGDPHTAVTRDALLPPTAIEVLTRVLGRDATPSSATSAAALLADPVRQLSADADRYVHAVHTAAQLHIGPAGLAAIDALAETTLPGLTAHGAYPTLRARLCLLSLTGGAPEDALRAAVEHPRGLDDAHDVAAVLDWRLDHGGHDSAGPLPWLPAVPAPLVDDPQWGDYLASRADRVTTLAAAVAATTTAWSSSTAPAWARPLLADPELVGDLAVWRAAWGIDTLDAAPSGPPQPGAAEAQVQRGLDDRVARALDGAGSQAASWRALAVSVDRRIVDDPFWPVLVGHLIAADSAGVDVGALVTTVAQRPLPDEQPAAALWWRLVDHLPPAGRTSVPVAPRGTPADNRSLALAKRSGTHTESAPVPRERLLRLHQLAADYFTAAYPGSWARAHLTGRLSTDPADLPHHVIGYAPPAWTGLTDHLRQQGAHDAEILAAGLATVASTGRVIDRLRDRAVFAIHGDDGIVGWIGRRNPGPSTGGSQSVPKYLNTPQTALFTKGDQLYGLAESQTELDAGAVPVVVEGPVDALAVTLAGGGQFVGIAPLGTAFSATQADKLHAGCAAHQQRLIVATDADAAGSRAAENMFWRLAARRRPPDSLSLPPGHDPADMLTAAGPEGLRDALAAASSLAGRLVEARIDQFTDRLQTAEGQVHAARRAAEVIAVLPSREWPRHLTRIVARTGLAADIVLSEVLTAAEQAAARHTTVELSGGHRSPDGPMRAAGDPKLPHTSLAATHREPPRVPPPNRRPLSRARGR